MRVIDLHIKVDDRHRQDVVLQLQDDVLQVEDEDLLVRDVVLLVAYRARDLACHSHETLMNRALSRSPWLSRAFFTPRESCTT